MTYRAVLKVVLFFLRCLKIHVPTCRGFSHVTALYFVNGRIGTSEILCPSRYLLEQSEIRRSLLRAALTPPAKQSPSKTRRSPKGGGALTIGRHRMHLADAGHGHAVVDFFNKITHLFGFENSGQTPPSVFTRPSLTF